MYPLGVALWTQIKRGLQDPGRLLKTVVVNPGKAWRHGAKALRTDLLRVHAAYQRKVRGREGTLIMDEDWDNLIILDACRYDLFAQCNTISGHLRADLSAGGGTAEFLDRNFAGGKFPDTVYITANPNCHYVSAEFHRKISLWEDHWDEELDTVRPEAVTESALELAAEYPHKRLLIHFIQPHYPFIGETGQAIEHGSLKGQGIISTKRTNPTIWEQLERGVVSEEVVCKAYRENIELTLPYVKRLVGEFTGKTVITSDHANVFGEWGIYGHKAGVSVPGLREVPWLEIDSGNRKRIESGSINEADSVDSDIDERLTALGYK